MTDEEKNKAAIDLLISKSYPRFVAEATVKVSGADKVLELFAPKAAPPAGPANRTHADECGDVGETGEHGDLGENAAQQN